ncbi:MAG: hypothetical protein OXI81_07100 [Paracoccaceae bacterium]|nr:hypothetical protein [Paracoccaceae bacterium]MDE2913659.1 hypothetical protein [Paracoccaceae bacterium]
MARNVIGSGPGSHDQDGQVCGEAGTSDEASREDPVTLTFGLQPAGRM